MWRKMFQFLGKKGFQRRQINLYRMLVLLILCLFQGCIWQDLISPPSPEAPENCVTPLYKDSPFSTRPNGISMTSDGSLIVVRHTFDGTYLFNPLGTVIWVDDAMGWSPIISKDGTHIVAQIRRKSDDDPFHLVKTDCNGDIIWNQEIGLIGLDGLAVTPDASFVAVGYMDSSLQGYLTLFDRDGTPQWTHQIDGRIETVAVSKSGYVVAGPRDRYIYLYNLSGDLIFTYFANSIFDSQDVAIAPDESFFLFGSEHQYLNCYSLQGELLWKRDIGPLCNISISADNEYIAVGTSNSTLYLFDRDGNQLWGKKATDAYFISEVSISGHGEYVVIESLEEPSFLVSNYCVVVYSKQGEILWKYWGTEPYLAIAISEDGHYVATGNKLELLFFDNFQAAEEYKSGECIS
jgi:outer membrane protein assembly factor BamB